MQQTRDPKANDIIRYRAATGWVPAQVSSVLNAECVNLVAFTGLNEAKWSVRRGGDVGCWDFVVYE